VQLAQPSQWETQISLVSCCAACIAPREAKFGGPTLVTAAHLVWEKKTPLGCHYRCRSPGRATVAAPPCASTPLQDGSGPRDARRRLQTPARSLSSRIACSLCCWRAAAGAGRAWRVAPRRQPRGSGRHPATPGPWRSAAAAAPASSGSTVSSSSTAGGSRCGVRAEMPSIWWLSAFYQELKH